MIKLIYKVSFERTCECLWYFRKEWYKGWRGLKTVLIKIPREIKNQNQLKKWLVQNFPEQNLIKLIKKLQPAWNKINDDFFKITEEIMETPWRHNTYFCYVQNAVVGHYHPLEDNIIFISDKSNNYNLIEDKLQETAEELIHQHYWNIWRDTFGNIKLPWRNFKTWLLSEVIADIIIFDERLRNFWKNSKRNYNFLKIKNHLMPIWVTRKSFKDFLLKAHKIKFKYS
jgi:hypothetical protein